MKSHISKTFCPLPWSAVSASPSGNLTPCCEFHSQHNGYKTSDIEEYRNSKWLQDIKHQFISGKWPKGCDICKYKEKNNSHSKRLEETKNLKNYYKINNVSLSDVENLEKYFLINLQVSNTCNLGCIMCTPHYSSFLQREAVENEISIFHSDSTITTNLSNNYTKEDIVKIAKLVDTAGTARIYITGGEPSVIKEVSVVLEEMISLGINNNIELEFNSNFQSFNPKFINLLKHFCGHAMVSIDHIGERGEYLRYPSKWNNVQANLAKFRQECPNFRITITPTIHNLNFLTFDQLLIWANQESYTVSLYNYLTRSDFLRANLLPEHLKLATLEKIKKIYIPSEYQLDDYTRLEQFIMTTDNINNYSTKLMHHLNSFDAIRGLNWKKIFPEMHNVLDNTYKR